MSLDASKLKSANYGCEGSPCELCGSSGAPECPSKLRDRLNKHNINSLALYLVAWCVLVFAGLWFDNQTSQLLMPFLGFVCGVLAGGAFAAILIAAVATSIDD